MIDCLTMENCTWYEICAGIRKFKDSFTKEKTRPSHHLYGPINYSINGFM